jgi:hypothetical protein
MANSLSIILVITDCDSTADSSANILIHQIQIVVKQITNIRSGFIASVIIAAFFSFLVFFIDFCISNEVWN